MEKADGEDIDVISYHWENHLLAVNLFHMRGGKVLDRREFFWEDLGEMETAAGFEVGDFFSTLLKQLYLDAHYIPRCIYIPVDFEDREALEVLLSEKRGARVHIDVPQKETSVLSSTSSAPTPVNPTISASVYEATH